MSFSILTRGMEKGSRRTRMWEEDFWRYLSDLGVFGSFKVCCVDNEEE